MEFDAASGKVKNSNDEVLLTVRWNADYDRYNLTGTDTAATDKMHITCHGSMQLEKNIVGDISAGGYVEVGGTHTGDISAGGYVEVGGTHTGDISAGGNVDVRCLQHTHR